MLRILLLAAAVQTSVATLSNVTQVCKNIANIISGQSDVIYPLDIGYATDIHHWFDSSTQYPACVLQAGSSNDVASALKIIGTSRTPFAVYSGGHASNVYFSSTEGVHICFSKMTQVELSNDKSTVELGMGLTWTTVYNQLEGTGVTVAGGRVPGPGVGGFTLGGGYSWKTNQHGLTSDNVKSFNVVLPNGTITVADSSTPDLFFALRGGMNRFGIVTSAVYYTVPQVPLVYGGFATYSDDDTEGLLNATAQFSKENQDTKAQVIHTIDGDATGGTSSLILYFYDGPNRPASFSVFDKFTPNGINTVKSQTFSSFVSGVPSKLANVANQRGSFNSLATSSFPPSFLAAVKNETDVGAAYFIFYGKTMSLHGGTVFSYEVDPFIKTYGQFDKGGAYPHSESQLPVNAYVAWVGEINDDYWFGVLRDSVRHLQNIAAEMGILSQGPSAYANYAIAGTTAEELYGSENAARLGQIRKQIDQDNVMGLTGGFNI